MHQVTASVSVRRDQIPLSGTLLLLHLSFTRPEGIKGVLPSRIKGARSGAIKGVQSLGIKGGLLEATRLRHHGGSAALRHQP